MGNSDVIIVIKAQDQVTDPLKEISGAVRNLGSNLEEGLGVRLTSLAGYWQQFLGAIGVSASLKGVYDLYENWENLTYRMETTFQARTQKMMDAAKNLSVQSGRYFSTGDFGNALAKSADIMERFGIDGEQHIELVSRAAGIAAARNMDLSDAIDSVTRAMEGNKKAGLNIGITLSDSYMKTMAFGGSLKDVWDNLDEVDKKQYRYQEFLRQSEKMAEAAAEKTKTLSGGMKALGNELRSGITEAFKSPFSIASGMDTMGFFTGYVEAMERAADKIKQKYSDLDANSKSTMADLETNMVKLEKLSTNYLSRGNLSKGDEERKATQERGQQVTFAERLNNLDKEDLELLKKKAEILSRPDTEKQITTFGSNFTTLMPADRSDLPEVEAKILANERARLETNKQIEISQQKQEQMDIAKINRLEEEMRQQTKVGLSGYESPVYREDTNKLYDIEDKAAAKLKNTLEQIWNIRYKMQTQDLDSEQYSAAQNQILNLQEDAAKAQGIISSVDSFFSQQETNRQNLIAKAYTANDEKHAKLKKEAEELMTTFNQAWGINVETDAAWKKIKSLIDISDNFKTSLDRVYELKTDTVESVTKLESIQTITDKLNTSLASNRYVDIDTSGVEAKILNVLSMVTRLNEEMAKGASFTVDMFMAKSPAKPWTEGYNELVKMMGGLPSGMDYTVRMLTGQGVSISDALGAYGIQKKMSALDAQVQSLLPAANDPIPTYGTGVGYSHINTSAQAKAKIEEIENQIDDLKLQYAQTIANSIGSSASGGSSSSGSAAGSNSITVQSLVTIDQIVIQAAAGDQDNAVSLALKIAPELSKQIKDRKGDLRATIEELFKR